MHKPLYLFMMLFMVTSCSFCGNDTVEEEDKSEPPVPTPIVSEEDFETETEADELPMAELSEQEQFIHNMEVYLENIQSEKTYEADTLKRYIGRLNQLSATYPLAKKISKGLTNHIDTYLEIGLKKSETEQVFHQVKIDKRTNEIETLFSIVKQHKKISGISIKNLYKYNPNDIKIIRDAEKEEDMIYGFIERNGQLPKLIVGYKKKN